MYSERYYRMNKQIHVPITDKREPGWSYFHGILVHGPDGTINDIDSRGNGQYFTTKSFHTSYSLWFFTSIPQFLL